MRERVHTAPEITDTVKRDVCSALRIPVSTFPEHVAAPALRLVPEAVSVLRKLSALGTVVTLSNVTRLEADTENLSRSSSLGSAATSRRAAPATAKPDPRAFLTAAARFDVPTSRVVHIGDDGTVTSPAPPRSGSPTDGRCPTTTLAASQDVLVADNLAAVVAHVRSLFTRRPA